MGYDLSIGLNFLFDSFTEVFNFLLYNIRVNLYGYNVSVLGVVICCIVATMILSLFLRSAKW